MSLNAVGLVIDRLQAILPAQAAWLDEAWRPPVSEADLAALRAAIAPWEVPSELVTLLQWHDGQEEGAWWPAFLGHLPIDPAARMARHFRERRELWLEEEDSPFLPTLLPITWHGWSLTCLELDTSVQRAVVRASLDDTDYAAAYPSLAAFLDVVGDMAEVGLLQSGPSLQGDAWPDFYRAAVPVINAATARYSNGSWAFGSHPAPDRVNLRRPRFSKFSSDEWPAHWRAQAEHPGR